MNDESGKPNADEQTGTKKVSLAEATKRMLEQKKQAQSQGKGPQGHLSTDTKKMKSQINKKPNNQKKRTGV